MMMMMMMILLIETSGQLRIYWRRFQRNTEKDDDDNDNNNNNNNKNHELALHICFSLSYQIDYIILITLNSSGKKKKI